MLDDVTQERDQIQIDSLLLTGYHYRTIQFRAACADLKVRVCLGWEQVLKSGQELVIIELAAFVHIENEAGMDVKNVEDLLQVRLKELSVLPGLEFLGLHDIPVYCWRHAKRFLSHTLHESVLDHDTKSLALAINLR